MDTTSATPDTTQKKRVFSNVFINRNFGLLWSGEVLSQLGDFIFDTTLIVWVAVVIGKGQAWTPLATSGVVLTTTLSMMIVGPIAGVFADRWEKRPTMLRVDVLQALAVAVLLLSTFLPLSVGWQLALIYLMTFVVNASDQFFNQAAFTLVSDVVPAQERPVAIGRMLTMTSIATIVGPAIGAPLIIALGPRLALCFNMCTFLVSFGTVYAIRVPKMAGEEDHHARRNGFWQEFRAGLGFLLGSHVLRTLLITGIVMVLGTSILNALNIFFVTQNLKTSPAFFGLIESAIGLGALLGSLVGGRIVKRLGMEKVYWGALMLEGALILIYARLSNPMLGLILFFALGLPATLFNIAGGSLVYTVTPREVMGRTNSARISLISVSAIAGAALAGYLDSTLLRGFHTSVLGLPFGPVDTLFTVTGILVLCSAVFALLNLRGAVAAPVSANAPTVTETPEAHEQVEG